MKKSIVWLASYPKSGNTWTRVFLANYLMNAKEPVPINEVHRLGMGDSIAKTYHMVAGRKIDVKNIELTLKLRDKVLRGIVGNNADINFVKTHNIRKVARGVPLIPEQYTKSAIYILRNPLDMVLSYARHYSASVEEAVMRIGREDNGNAPDEKTVAQYLGKWSDHVDSWTKNPPFPLLTIRYEDLLAEPEKNFTKVLEHIGVPVDQDRLNRAVEFSSFKALSEQEKKTGFVEKPKQAEKFFNKGQSGQWKEDLSEELIQKIKRDHGNVMKRFGYLS
ncbi:Sulfotransferase domain protein [Roseovarius albus]|uniref:Sulfotransferase domain protein n=2 Tax=Roseovarius albus TaxID=1247867 RepID=A0A1X7A0K0_9RHOB|nr:Sulfotransferase domain protein [Roseovarius albus]